VPRLIADRACLRRQARSPLELSAPSPGFTERNYIPCSKGEGALHQFLLFSIAPSFSIYKFTSLSPLHRPSTSLPSTSFSPLRLLNPSFLTMGNICSRGSNDPEAFSSPGRVVGTNPSNQSAAPRASVPAKANWKNTPGRTLGASSTGETQGNSDEARSNAAIAAQVSIFELKPSHHKCLARLHLS